MSRNIGRILVIVSGSALLKSFQSAPVSPIGRRARASSYPKRRSPFLGISSHSDLYRQSSNQSLEWDNYTSSPSFNQRNSQIPVISTPTTSLESFSSRESIISTNMGNVAKDISELRVCKIGVEEMMEIFPVRLMTGDRLGTYNDDLNNIKTQYLKFCSMLASFSEKHSSTIEFPNSTEGEPMNLVWWKQQKKNLSDMVTNHEFQIRDTAGQLYGAKGMSEFEKKDLELKERQLVLMENEKKSRHSDEKVKSNAIAQSKYDEIIALASELEGYLNEVSDWSSASRAEVIAGMKSLDKWGKLYSDLNKAQRDFNVSTASFPLPEENEKVVETIHDMDELYSTVTKAIQEEDRKRLLYSLVGASSESVRLPKFSGSLGEDFSTFKSKLLLGLEKNRVAATDKIEKLRSCLSGQALALVPEKSKDFDAAMKVLADAFGDSEKVLAARINELKSLGKCPPETSNGKLNYKAVVSYCLKLETLVQDLIDLAESGKEELKYDVYGSSVRTSIQNLFSLKEIKKLRSLTGRGKVGLEEHVQFVKDLRVKAQSMVDPGEVK